MFTSRTNAPLARALWLAPARAGRDRARAGELGELARAAYAEAPLTSARELAEIETWLSEHTTP